ncbi:Uncharacterised protein [Mycobacteroides abscessus subsp. abscessus]|nr:Uncharacterised protein [Mycobacteroides abscessus subsp. abscessus]
MASTVNPRSASRFTGNTSERLSRLATETKMVPSLGSDPYAAVWLLANALPKSASIPITSPVDFISGPSRESTPLPSALRNRWNGSTASLTATGAPGNEVAPSPSAGSRPSSRRPAMVAPNMMRAHALAKGTAVALETNGTVRLARGLASRT